MFTKQHYKVIAEAIAVSRISKPLDPKYFDYESGINAGCQDIMYRLIGYFEQDNSRFDRDKFVAACGID